MFIIFGHRVYRERFLFLDDLSVATGRKACLAEGPARAGDVTEGGFLVVLESGDGEPTVGDYLRHLRQEAEGRERYKKT